VLRLYSRSLSGTTPSAIVCFILSHFSCQDQFNKSLHPLHNQHRPPQVTGRTCPPSPIPTLRPTLADLAELRLHLITRQRADLSDVADGHCVPIAGVSCCAGHSLYLKNNAHSDRTDRKATESLYRTVRTPHRGFCTQSLFLHTRSPTAG
jgi:hypothetical protein